MRRSLMLLAGGLSLACSANVGTNDEMSGAPTEAPATETAQAIEAPTQTFTIELGGNHRLIYSAYKDGALIVSEQGVVGTDKPVAESIGMLSPVEAFRQVRPGQAVPAELEALEVIHDAAVVDETEEAELASGAEAGLPQGLIPKVVTSDPATFFNQWGCFFGENDVYAACLPNRGEWANVVSTARWAIFKVAPYLGDVTVRHSLAGSVRAVYPVYQGNFHWTWARGGLVRHSKRDGWFGATYYKTYPNTIAHQFELVDAAGDQFHLSARTHNYQYGGINCAETASRDASVWVREGTAADCPHNHYY